MKKQSIAWIFTIILGLVSPAYGAIIYDMSFDTDPLWTTDQAENFYWDADTGVYIARTETEPTSDVPNRYGYTSVNLDTSQSFTLTWDQSILEQSGDSTRTFFGLTTDDLNFRAHTPTHGTNYVPESTVNFGVGNVYSSSVLERGLQLPNGDNLGGGSVSRPLPGTNVDQWYTFGIEYDSTNEIVTWSILDRESQVQIFSEERAMTGPFSPDMVNLAVGAMPHGYGMSGDLSTTYQVTAIDNILLEGEYLEDPASTPLVLNAPFYSDQAHYLTQGVDTDFSHRNLLINDLDFSLHGSDVVASAAGIVTYHYNDSFGNYAIVDHGESPLDSSERLFTLYAHLDSTVSALEGAYIEAGTRLGAEGSTGRAYGAVHIHYGVYSGDPTKDPYLEPGSWTSVGIDGDTVVFEADVAGNDTVETFTSGSMFDPFVCEDGVYIESCRFYSLLDRPDSILSTGLISEGEVFAYTLFLDGLLPVEAFLTWPGSELLLEVYDPTGSLHSSLSETDGFISFYEGSPFSGFWSFVITGIVTADGGEPFEFRVNTVSVSEPATLALMGLGLAGIGFARKKKA